MKFISDISTRLIEEQVCGIRKKPFRYFTRVCFMNNPGENEYFSYYYWCVCSKSEIEDGGQQVLKPDMKNRTAFCLKRDVLLKYALVNKGPF
jgi:hypothetical protein